MASGERPVMSVDISFPCHFLPLALVLSAAVVPRLSLKTLAVWRES